jgi:hypothetical protein
MNTITSDALVKRINRKLAHAEQRLRKARGHYEPSLGDYYVVDIPRNFIIEKHIDPEELGRRLGVMLPAEKVEG